MNKYGMLTKESVSDFDSTKKAEFYDEAGYQVADRDNKDKLNSPKKIEQLPEELV
jgi:hypothetical protein